MGLTLISASTTAAITLDEAKAHLNVTISASDTYIQTLIDAAQNAAEQITRRKFINTTYDLTLDRFPGCYGIITLPKPPLSSVTSISYYNDSNALTTLASAAYTVDKSIEPGLVKCSYGYYWPTTYPRPDAVTVRFVAGYGTAGTSVPASLRHAMKMLIGHWHENREEVVATGLMVSKIPFAAEMLLQLYSMPEV